MVTQGGSLGVKVNGVEVGFFTTSKGLRQGGPLSPFLLNLLVDVLTKMLSKASQQTLINGLYPNYFLGGVISLQHGDDIILFVYKNHA